MPPDNPRPRVVIESPYAGEVGTHEDYARRAMADCVALGESPYASHLLFTQPGILDDTKPEERALGIAMGFSWAELASKRVFYVDYGFSRGMVKGLGEALRLEQKVELRSIGENE